MITIANLDDKSHRTYIASYGCDLFDDGKFVTGVSISEISHSQFSLESHTRKKSIYLANHKISDFVEEIKVLKLINWKDFHDFNLYIEIYLSRDKKNDSIIRFKVGANLENWVYPFSFAAYKTTFQNLLKENRPTKITIYPRSKSNEIVFDVLHCFNDETISDVIKPIELLLETYHVNTKKNLNTKKYDVFISHASEDKEDFVRPLAEALIKAGFDVWYDEFELKVADKLRRSIDKGLANSRFGIVVFSPDFFKKNWTQYELDALVQREMTGENVIIPIWHRVAKDEVMKFSPSLADTVALSSSIYTIDELVNKISEVLK